MSPVLATAVFAVMLAMLAAPVAGQDHAALFSQWMKEHGKEYSSFIEQASRMEQWIKNFIFVSSHNPTTAGFTVGALAFKHIFLHHRASRCDVAPLTRLTAMNKFGDLSGAEFAAKVKGFRMPRTRSLDPHPPRNISVRQLPAAVDWRNQGVVTPVKDQGQCGSCWTFSTTGATESAYAIATGQLVVLSEQNLLDCTTDLGEMGCDGGLMDPGFQYIIAHGIDTEAAYPYQGQGPLTCRFNPAGVGATLTAYHDVAATEDALQQAVAQNGPVSIAIDASQMSFQFYSGGVYNEPSMHIRTRMHLYSPASVCSSTQLDHAVLAVGYDHDASTGQDYWIVKNV